MSNQYTQGLDPRFNPFRARPLKGTKIKKIIAVMSGKGGVGKSTVTAMLASSSQRLGYQTGIIDGDIIGPSMGHMFNIYQPLYGEETGIYPAMTETGIKMVSSQQLVADPSTPILWRGALIGNTLVDFYTKVFWEELDILWIDMPPGTGDIAITAFQSLPVNGTVIVTSPQELVSMIVSKAIEMSHQMDVPILGLVENYASFVCPNCDEIHYPFGRSDAQELTERYNLPLLAQLPINSELNKLTDSGQIEFYEDEMIDEIVKNLLGDNSDV